MQILQNINSSYKQLKQTPIQYQSVLYGQK
jgi:hypothetical protein